MTYKRAVRFEGGETLIACSICGFPYLFPSELTYCDDRLFRCTRTCMEETRQTDLQRQVQSQKRKDQIAPPLTGPMPTWRTPNVPPGAPIAWFDAQDIDLQQNATLTDGAAVTTWRNKGSLGAALDITQATGSLKPRYRYLGANGKCLNKSSVEFDDRDAILQSAAISVVAQPLLVAAVLIPKVSAFSLCTPFDGRAGGQVQVTVNLGSGNQFTVYAGAFYVGAVATASRANYVVVLVNGASSGMTVNDVAASTGNVGAEGLAGVTIGGIANGTAAFFGHVYAYLAWAGTLPSIASVSSYLTRNYGPNWPQ